jgi:hypothetical protein
MRIGAVSMNSSVNRTQTAIKKISAISKPRTFAVDEVSDNLSNVGQIDRESHLHDGAKNRLDTLGSEVDVWV